MYSFGEPDTDFAATYLNLLNSQVGDNADYHNCHEGGYINGTLSDSDSGSDAPSTPATPTNLHSCWEQVYPHLHDTGFHGDAHDASDGVTPPQSPYDSEFSYVPRGLHLEQLTPTESDPCKVVTNEGETYAIINGFIYPIDPEVPDTVPADEHPRPARKSQRAERLWEFLLRLLKDEKSNPSLIQWVDQSAGTFRLTNSKTIAQMWGRRKSNENMTYEKLSRAMRYYYARNILRPVLGKKLVYSFGPKARGWRPHEKA